MNQDIFPAEQKIEKGYRYQSEISLWYQSCGISTTIAVAKFFRFFLA